MKQVVVLAFFAIAGVLAAPAAPASPSPPRLAAATSPQLAGAVEADAVLAAIWAAAETLPATKQDRLKPDILALAASAPDPALRTRWEKRLGAVAAQTAPQADYAARQAAAVIADDGWSGFLDRAARQSAPFHIGRPEIMAAGVRLAPDAATAARVIAAMTDLARTKPTRGGLGDNFERGDFGHALAELGMQRCDLALFDRAAALTPEPDALRYALWRARIIGGASKLTTRIAAGDGSDDTRHVRQAIEGYAPVLTLGYCGG